jgi:hypothetical protein
MNGREVDPDSYAGQFGDRDNLVFTEYAPQHDEPRLFHAWIRHLRGDVEAHLLSAGAGIFWRFLQFCQGRPDVRFRIVRLVFLNPATGPDGLQPKQRGAVRASAYLAHHLPRLRHSQRLQRWWTDGLRLGGHKVPLWSAVWPASDSDTALAADYRGAAYNRYRGDQQLCSVQRIITTTASLALPAFTGGPVKPGFEVCIILLEEDDILVAAHNEQVIRDYYQNIKVYHITESLPNVGGHDSSLVLRPDFYRYGYQRVTTDSRPAC